MDAMEKKVLGALVYCPAPDNAVDNSLNELVGYLKLPRKKIQETLNTLEDEGIVVSNRRDGVVRYHTMQASSEVRYDLRVDELCPCIKEKVYQRVSEDVADMRMRIVEAIEETGIQIVGSDATNLLVEEALDTIASQIHEILFRDSINTLLEMTERRR